MRRRAGQSALRIAHWGQNRFSQQTAGRLATCQDVRMGRSAESQHRDRRHAVRVLARDCDEVRTLQAKEKFRDPIWRIGNLYSIRTREGKLIPFRPRPQQQQVLEMIFKQGLKRIVILKLANSDSPRSWASSAPTSCAGQPANRLSFIDRTQENARQKLRDIVTLAYDSLHAELKARFIVDRSNTGEFGVRFHEYDQAQTSTLFAGTHARGGANSFLWISEWGYVQCEDLRRSEEILTGALPSAKDGTIVVETTWRGDRGGHLGEGDPTEQIDKTREIDHAVSILTVPQARKLLAEGTADEECRSLLASIAVGLFAGLRTGELASLDWENNSSDGQPAIY